MSMFNIGLSGLSSTQKALEVTSNNIANASTAGYKTASTEFSALYNGGQRSGVKVAATNENFEKTGGLVSTGQSLDLAITGKGFFVVNENGRLAFTQAGQFGLDENRQIVNNNGSKLQGFGIDENGNLITGILTDLKVEAANIPAKATENIAFSLNLNSASDVIPYPVAPAVFDPADGTSFNYSQSTEVFDSLGNSHTLTQYFNHTGVNTWAVVYYMDGKPLPAADLNPPAGAVVGSVDATDDTGVVTTAATLTITFDTDGQLSPMGTLPAPPLVPADNNVTDPYNVRELTLDFAPAGASVMAIKLDMVKSSQFGSAFGLYENNSDGYTSGEFTGVAVAEDGKVLATFSNGESKLQGQIALANFANPQGLESGNNTVWYASEQSGAAIIGTPSEGSFGAILAGSFMGSNVDISAQLVDLMSFQQSYQANAKTISTADEMMQVLFNAV
ncbi:flagellar hook-basal body complex protein [Rheinheimera sp.]|uniref:flagellar hook-basal body complex protein n=1 Tax=Rheinheimera sp. TaxID=1869214 RepID=UPI0027BB219A|nr:flagellar hook-basal body complex protein [Rheinheimera sp.]